MSRRFATPLVMALLFALSTAAAPRPAAPSVAWWSELVAQVRAAVAPQPLPREQRPAPASSRHGRGFLPACSSGMDPNGRCG